MEQTILRSKFIPDRSKAALLVIDIQERILGVMKDPELVIKNTIKLIQGFKILNMPIFNTEQYPQGLGITAEAIRNELNEIEPIQKMSFSCSGAGELFSLLKMKNISQVIICGIEAHVCVQQTALDLLANEFQVFVAADATSSRKETDHKFALDRMRHHGIEVTTTEAILFELLNVCGTDDFKKIAKIVK